MIITRVRLIIPHQQQLLLQYNIKGDYFFYPGGKIESYETISQTAIREMREEINRQCTFEKLLYIREYIDQQTQTHSIEFFALGHLDDYQISIKPIETQLQETHQYLWYPVDDLPKNLLPAKLTPILQEEFQQGFPSQPKYLGAI